MVKKSISLALFILVIHFTLNCSRNYEGDLESFSLEGEWLYRFSNSINPKEIQSLKDGWMDAVTPIVFHKTDMKIGDRKLWLKKEFVLPGHFVDKSIYLNLGEYSGRVEFYLNGRLLDNLNQIQKIRELFSLKYRLIELHPANLHFGQHNQLLIEKWFIKTSDSLLIDQPTIYSRTGFLQGKGFTISECPYYIERDLHAFIEDFSLAWMYADSSEVINFFAENFRFKRMDRTIYVSKLLRLRDVYSIEKIELGKPNFYNFGSDTKILVFADWVIQLYNQKTYHLPFILESTKTNEKWLFLKIY